MSRVDPFTLPRRDRPVSGPLTFKEPGGGAIVVALRALDVPQQMRAIAAAQEMCRRYIEDPENPNPDLEEFWPVGGEPVDLSELLFQATCILEAMQVDAEGADRYTVPEWIAFSLTMPTAYQAAQAESSKIQAAYAKNASGASTTTTP